MRADPVFRNLSAGEGYDPLQRGLYMVRSTVDTGKVRIGSAGGSRSGKGVLKDRVPKHCRTWSGKVTVETHRLSPYEPICVWELPDWPWTNVAMGEMALYAAVEEAGFARHQGEQKDNSNYNVAPDVDLTPIFAAVDQRLAKLKLI